MEKKIRKMIVRLDVVEVDKLMAYSKTQFPRIPISIGRKVGLVEKMWRSLYLYRRMRDREKIITIIIINPFLPATKATQDRVKWYRKLEKEKVTIEMCYNKCSGRISLLIDVVFLLIAIRN